MLRAARQAVTIPVHPSIRPRGGDFCYTAGEFSAMLEDIALVRDLGFPGLVIGVLDEDGNIDLPRMRQVMRAARGMVVTFHRAFDVCINPFEAMEQIIALGCKRILTSGQQATALKGATLLQELNRKAAGRIILLAGSGVNENNIDEIAGISDIHEYHFSARTPVPSLMEYRKPGVPMGGTVEIDEYSYPYTSVEKVKKTIDALNKSK